MVGAKRVHDNDQHVGSARGGLGKGGNGGALMPPLPALDSEERECDRGNGPGRSFPEETRSLDFVTGEPTREGYGNPKRQ